MKLQQILIESIHQTAKQTLKDVAEKVFGTEYVPFDLYPGGQRTWKRGDGRMYKDPAEIRLDRRETKWLKDNNKYPEGFENDAQMVDAVWKAMKEMPGAKPAGKVKGEFGSSEFEEAIQIGKTFFIRRGDYAIAYVSASVFRNLDVWKRQK